MKALVSEASKSGSTAEVAESIGDELRVGRLDVEVRAPDPSRA
jgi:flavodoxin